ncbi:uncharacterized protein PFL1_03048 [Pseudozyma flocculosa PF-1]|uniref:1-phosphatidylinositol 4-kinase n=2 Tax=Pseudozyma flocculosa TaxID=84751 RepID=A0A5C3F1B5_9BASI|nr:uncharacterized protein PFL1_03048 [Pseudozyma flocculosa PF-1]EPQ29293.1 hypothetical protein PFL1_03048 [Pseudozyma flocculosa PF-1]SPO37805.1 related to LSB6 - Phosphatidylinositol 4-kinase [Pseudozyma flocculosa]
MTRLARPAASASDRTDDERTPLLASSSNQGSANIGDPPATAIDRDDDEDAAEDELDFDARFRKWKAAVAQKFRRSNRSKKRHPKVLVSVFDGVDGSRQLLTILTEAKRQQRIRSAGHDATLMSGSEFEQQVRQVKRAIEQGIYPKMITTGSSGSYFVRVPNGDATSTAAATTTTTVAVFKPKDEEPYGNLNPKRQFVRKYLWWAMGRPCLIPNFSYLSEVGASYLDSRLVLQMVPRTELVELSSPSFHYAYADRKAFETSGKRLPEKIGSYQTFLNGYVMASDFLRKHPWPSRSRSLALMLRDFDDERQAHKVSRKQEKARLRKCGIALKRLLLCRTGFDEPSPQDEEDAFAHPSTAADGGTHRATSEQPHGAATMSLADGAADASSIDAFVWTPHRMQSFRLELEKLVVLDFLMRNTDRGLDNFMVHHDAATDEIKIGAIDNSLSFPIKHPNEIRQYPFGWLWLPSDLIGLPFSQSTRQHFLPILNDPLWWQDTVHGLRTIFAKDPHFDEAKFERQISVMKGQAWNLVRSLENSDEGPLDLCAREKKLVVKETLDATEDKLAELEGVKLPLSPTGLVRTDALGRPDGLRGLGLFDTPIKPKLTRDGSSSKAHFGPYPGRASGSRPIGVRASMSYRQALIYAAGGMASPAEGAHPRSLPENDLTDPFEDRLGGETADDADVSASLQQSSTHHQQRPSLHQRIMSLQEPGTTSALLLGEPGGDRAVAPLDTPQPGYDTVVGKTGIEILESLDKQRRKESKILIFGGPGRKRSSTESTVNTVDIAKPSPSRAERKRALASDGLDDATGGEDMISSIVSDPGMHRHGLHRRSSSDAVHRRMASSGYIRREASSQWDEGVLSEEDEEDEEEANDGRAATPRYSQGLSDRAQGRGGPAGGAVVPSIEGVLARSGQAATPAARERTGSSSSRRQHVPHLPHARALAVAVDVADDDDGGEDAGAEKSADQGKGARVDQQGRPGGTTADEGGATAVQNGMPNRSTGSGPLVQAVGHSSKGKKAAKRKIKVAVERLVSDTRQAWLTWM